MIHKCLIVEVEAADWVHHRVLCCNNGGSLIPLPGPFQLSLNRVAMNNLTLTVVALLVLAGPPTLDLDSSSFVDTLSRSRKNVSQQKEAGGQKAETIELFNGKDLTGWHVDVPQKDNDPDAPDTFIVRDGNLVSLGKPNGHLITDAEFKNYRLEVEYRFAGKPGNCGVLVHASTPRALYKMFPKSIEVQMNHQHAGDFWCIVEDITVPDMVKRRGPKEKWGITEGKARRILNLTDDSEKAVGQWNAMVIECIGDEVKVWVNGDLVNHGTKCTAVKGQIALQAEGSEVEFRKLSLTPITKLSD